MEINHDLLKAIISQSHCHLNNEIEKHLKVVGITKAEIKLKIENGSKKKLGNGIKICEKKT